MEFVLPACFKAYDIRGKVPDELNPELARKIGMAFQAVFGVKKVVIGRDIRLTGPELLEALKEGLVDMGVEVLDLGICGTEEIYHATFSLEDEGVDGGIIITASHNPADYNGMKLVVGGARPVSGDSGLHEMARLIVEDALPAPAKIQGKFSQIDHRANYIDHLLSYIEVDKLHPLKIVVNSGNGCAGPVVDLLEKHLPFTFIKMHHQGDGKFPHGVPNPLLPEKRQATSDMVKKHGADFGVAWDGDFDRCFFWDEAGEFVEGYYLVGLLAIELLASSPGAKIIHDPRLIWNSEELISQASGISVMTKTGHAFIKERMRKEDAVYGGEMSAHHYFKDFGYCDSGMIPWLLVASLLSKKELPLSQMVADRIAAYPISGEINNRVANPDNVIATILEHFQEGEKDYTDGLSISFPDYRFNIRKSNTEPLLRLNVESRGDRTLLEQKTAEILQFIK